ncbi:MAG: cytochrome P450 [Myxococcales bacterium]|nr:cytochrome P450 [Myxococcales bacterium]
MQIQSLLPRALRSTAAPTGLRLPPRLSGGRPLVGHTIEFVRSTIDLLYRAQRELGEVAAFDVLHRRMVAVFGPDAHEAVFRAPDEQLSPSEAYKIMTPVFGKDIVYDAPPDKMAEQLRMLLPALKDRRMRTYGQAIVYETELGLEDWGDDGTVDFVDFCRALTSFTSSRCLLGPEFREGMTEEFAAVYHDLEGGVTPLSYIHPRLPLPSFIRRDRARARMVEMISDIIVGRRRDARRGEDFVQTLMEARYKDGRPLSEHEITGLLLAGIFAGHHTSSVTTAWTLIELLSNRECLGRLVDEVDSVFDSNEPVTHRKLRDLEYTEAVVKEALRLHPPLFVLVRVAKQDFVYRDYFIERGSWVLVSPTVSHRLAEHFAEPDRFDPMRFLPPREEDKRHNFAYIAFGGGRHKCLGNAFALLQVKAILAVLLRRYEFELAGDPIGSDFRGLVIGPREPCRVHYKRRAGAVPTLDFGRLAAEVAGHITTHQSAAAAAAAAATEASAEADADASSGPLQVCLDRDLCQGHAVCVGEAPQVFRVGDDGKVAFADHDDNPDEASVPGRHAAAVREALRYCPTRAISLKDG